VVLRGENTEVSTDRIVQDLDQGTEKERGRGPAPEIDRTGQEAGVHNLLHEALRQF